MELPTLSVMAEENVCRLNVVSQEASPVSSAHKLFQEWSIHPSGCQRQTEVAQPPAYWAPCAAENITLYLMTRVKWCMQTHTDVLLFFLWLRSQYVSLWQCGTCREFLGQKRPCSLETKSISISIISIPGQSPQQLIKTRDLITNCKQTMYSEFQNSHLFW